MIVCNCIYLFVMRFISLQNVNHFINKKEINLIIDFGINKIEIEIIRSETIQEK